MRRLSRAVLIAAIGLVLGCASAAQPTPTPASQSEDTCGLARYRHLLGRKASELAPADLPPRARIICPQCMVTQNYRADRLNLFTDAEGRIASMRCF